MDTDIPKPKTLEEADLMRQTLDNGDAWRAAIAARHEALPAKLVTLREEREALLAHRRRIDDRLTAIDGEVAGVHRDLDRAHTDEQHCIKETERLKGQLAVVRARQTTTPQEAA